MRELLRLFKAILLARRRPVTDWIFYVSAVQLALNSAHRQRLGRSPFELMLGPRASGSSVVVAPASSASAVSLEPVDFAAHQEQFDALASALDAMHKATAPRQERQRFLGRESSKRGELPNFSVGDFVLVARVRIAGKTSKLQATWMGPFRVTSVSAGHTFVVQHLLNGSLLTVHASRLLFYHDALLEITTELKERAQFVEEQGLFEVEKLVKVERREGQWQALVAWLGFEESERTWEPLSNLLEDRKIFIISELRRLSLSPKIRTKLATELHFKF
jgi:hypothetical protein